MRLMRKVWAPIGSAIFLVVAPGFVAGVAPWWISHWEGVLDCFARFALPKLGTPPPIAPTRHLVVAGMYRHVRNPMYISVAVTILGQGLIFGNVALLAYGGLVWLLFHIFVRAYEEPMLRASFGGEYETFRAEVPRWIPRITRRPVRPRD